MTDWIILLLAATLGSIISLIGGLYLIYGKRGVAKLQKVAVPFAAGALLAAAFLDLLPEALEHGQEPKEILLAALSGLLFFFLLERGLSWFHHHHEEDATHSHTRRNVWLIVIGDTLHNFLDGLALGAAFLISPTTGVIAAIAIAAHEIPQEIGDFGLMLSKGMPKKRVFFVNIVSALMTVIGAALVFGFGKELPVSEAILLALTAGFFIYIATSDIIPSIHAEPRKRLANIQAAFVIVGVVFVGVTSSIAHSFVEQSSKNHDKIEAHATTYSTTIVRR